RGPLVTGVQTCALPIYDVPGSKAAPDLVQAGQVRTFSRPLTNRSPIRSLAIESYDNAVAPTFVAVTADTAERSTGDYADASAQRSEERRVGRGERSARR